MHKTGINRLVTDGAIATDYIYGPSGWVAFRDGGMVVIDQNGMRRESVRGLYEVFIVDLRTDMVDKHMFIANSEEQVKLKAVQSATKGEALIGDITDYAIIARLIGSLPAKT